MIFRPCFGVLLAQMVLASVFVSTEFAAAQLRYVADSENLYSRWECPFVLTDRFGVPDPSRLLFPLCQFHEIPQNTAERQDDSLTYQDIKQVPNLVRLHIKQIAALPIVRDPQCWWLDRQADFQIMLCESGWTMTWHQVTANTKKTVAVRKQAPPAPLKIHHRLILWSADLLDQAGTAMQQTSRRMADLVESRRATVANLPSSDPPLQLPEWSHP